MVYPGFHERPHSHNTKSSFRRTNSGVENLAASFNWMRSCVYCIYFIGLISNCLGVGMIIRDRKTPGPGFSLEFHKVLNSSVVYLACDRDIGIVFICESSYNNERFNINSDTTVTSSSQQNINEFEIGNNGEISDGGNQFVLTCQPKDENGNIQTLSITAMLTGKYSISGKGNKGHLLIE